MPDPILTPAIVREHIETSVPDTALQRLINDADLAVLTFAGPIGDAEDRRRGGGVLLFLSRTAGSITEVIERYGDVLGLTDVTLDPTDYTLMPGGHYLRREWTGIHRSDRWADNVIVRYAAQDDVAARIRVELELVQLELNHQPGLVMDAAGPVQERYPIGTGDYREIREAILATLRTPFDFA